MYDLQGIGPEETAKAMLATRRIKVADTNFLPLHQHQVIAISDLQGIGGSLGPEQLSD